MCVVRGNDSPRPTSPFSTPPADTPCACLSPYHRPVQVSSLASSLSPLVERVAELESRLHRSLAIAKQGLDILADQLVALGAMNGRGSPNKKNPLAGRCVCVFVCL